MKRRRYLGLALLVPSLTAWLIACGQSNDGDPSEGSDGGANGSGDSSTDRSTDDDDETGFDIGTTGEDTDADPVGEGRACDAESSCPSNQVCHPTTMQCALAGATCDDHPDCAEQTFCDAVSSTCLSGLAGSPCEDDDNCVDGSECSGGICACSGFQLEQETIGSPLDIYFIFDRTASMGRDCDYVPGTAPPVDSKACFATYALPDYLINVEPQVNTRFAFQFMSYEDGCDGAPYSTPLVPLTELPVSADHQLISEISNENFRGGSGTQIEGALIGISHFTQAARTEGREMIGVLMTDGDPNGCNDDVDELAALISDHLSETGIRTFVIGMNGATESNLEQLAVAGGAEPHEDFCGSVPAPCHYWNVGDGAGDAIADALQAIAKQAAPFPCEYALADIEPPDGSSLDLTTLNVQLVQDGQATLIGKAEDESKCPTDVPAWYYDDNDDPTALVLCQNACDLVTSAEMGATMNVVGGCSETMIIH